MIAALANLAWLASHGGAAGRFRRQLGAPQATQERMLRELLHRNSGSAFGQQHGFAGIRTPAEFARNVPLTTYGDLEPWINRIMRGEKSVLTEDEVTHLVPTSGSSGARKLIPYTAQLARGFDAAIGPWIADLYSRHPAALLGPSYWSVSPTLQATETIQSAAPIGFEDDTSYLGGARRRLVAATMAAPPELRAVQEIETFFVLTLVCLLRRRDLRLISVWHPSFLLLLLDALPRHWESLLAILHHGRLPPGMTVPPAVEIALRLSANATRAAELRSLGPERPDALWPRLAIISCWTDAHAALGAAALSQLFPRAVLQPKGLLATEAFVTLPFDCLHPVAIGSHYFEFIDAAGALQPVQALQQDQIYEVVVTTGGGLWRYRLGDRVRVTGFAARTPSLRFIGRAGEVSDLFGEKLSGEFVAGVLQSLGKPDQSAVRFAMLAPEVEGISGVYTLYWEGGAPPAAGELDRLLCANPHYAWCRQLGQLRPARVFLIRTRAMAAYYRRVATPGQKLGELKPPALASTTGWAEYFTADLVN